MNCNPNANVPVCSGDRAGESLWQQTVGDSGPSPEGQARQAVQRTLAQPPQSQRKEVLMDS